MELYNNLFEILRAGMFSGTVSDETKSLINNGDTLGELFKIAKKHDLDHLLAYSFDVTGLSETVAGLKEKCSKLQFLAVYRYENMNHELKRICDVFEENEIPFIVLKGAVLRRYYPEPWMRTSCDIDILVKEDEVDKARELLIEKLGFTFVRKNIHDYQMDSPGGVNLELHFTLLGDEITVSKTADSVLDDVWERTVAYGNYKYGYEMEWDMFWYYHILHLAKHIKQGGCGIKPFLDLYILLDMRESLLYENKLIERGGIEKISRVSVKLAKVYFANEDHNETTSVISDYVLYGGAYGNKKNQLTIKRTSKSGKMHYFWSRVFSPYEILSERYPEIKGKRWLTIPYQFRRWFDIVFKGSAGKAIKELQINSDISDENVKNARKILDDLGL